MQDKIYKWRYILFPFLTGSLLLVGGYAAVRLLADRYGHSEYMTREMWELWLPMLLAALVPWASMRGRFRLLGVSAGKKRGYRTSSEWAKLGKEGRRREFLYWAAAIPLAVAMIGSQKYITSQNRRLIEVESIAAIGRPRPDDCFRVAPGYRVETRHAGVLWTNRTIPKRYGSDELELVVYCAVPMEDGGALSARLIPVPGQPHQFQVLPFSGYTYWIAKRYTRRVKDRSREGIDRESRQLSEQIEADLTSGAFGRFDHLRAQPYSQERRSMLRAIENAPARAAAEPVILIPETTPFRKTASGLWWAAGSLALAFVLVAAVVFSAPPIPEKRLAVFIARARRPWRERIDPRNGISRLKSSWWPATVGLIALNAAAFVVTLFAGIDPFTPTPHDLFDLGGATNRSIVEQSEGWRIFTAMFLHAGIFHLAPNMLTLFLTGGTVETAMGRWKYLSIYFASGIGAALLSIAFVPPTVVQIGASGAIFGVMGAMLSVYVREPKKHKDYLLIFLLTGGISLLMGLLPGINNYAHLGGLLTGFVLGLLVYRPARRRQKRTRSCG